MAMTVAFQLPSCQSWLKLLYNLCIIQQSDGRAVKIRQGWIVFGRNLATTSSSLPWLLRRSFLIKRLDPRFSNSAGGQDRGIESVSLSSTVIVIVREFEPDDAQKISEGRMSCQFNLLSLRFFAFSTYAGSIVQRTLWAFWPAMAAMGRENKCYRQAQGKLSGKHPPCSSWIWIVKDRLQMVTACHSDFVWIHYVTMSSS